VPTAIAEARPRSAVAQHSQQAFEAAADAYGWRATPSPAPTSSFPNWLSPSARTHPQLIREWTQPAEVVFPFYRERGSSQGARANPTTIVPKCAVGRTGLARLIRGWL